MAKEVGDAYIAWSAQQNKSHIHIAHVKQYFRELIRLPECGNLPLKLPTLAYFRA